DRHTCLSHFGSHSLSALQIPLTLFFHLPLCMSFSFPLLSSLTVFSHTHTHTLHKKILTLVLSVCSFDEKEQNIKVPLLSLPAAHCYSGAAVRDLRSVRSGQRPDRNSSSLSCHSYSA